MKIYRKRRSVTFLPIFFLTIVVLSSKGVYAQPYSYDFTSELAVWDLSGTYEDEALDCYVSLTMNQDARGKITGSGSANCSVWESGILVDLNFTYDIKGSVKQNNNIATVKLSIKFRGTAEAMGESFKFTASEKIMAEIDASNQVMTGTIKVKAKVAGERMSETAGFYEDLPDDMDGSFNLTFEAYPEGNNLVGDGTLTLSNGEQFSFSVKGKTRDKTGETKFKLKGDATKLKLMIESDDSLNSIKGKVLGQKIVR
jgi:hypothetical protein